MRTDQAAAKPRQASDLVLRGIFLFFIGLLVVLPVLAISVEAFRSGFGSLWAQITHPQALAALWLTLRMAMIMVLINVLTGTATAWVLVRHQVPFRGLINALVDIPFAIPTVVTGMMLVVLYGPRSVLGTLLARHGIEVVFSRPGIVLALLFVTFPFVVRAVQPVLMEMEGDMEEAASTLGAGRIRTFFRVVLPTLLPAILSGAALSFSRALGEFGSIIIVAGNIPMRTQVASVYIYGEIESGSPESAMGLSVVLLVISLLTLLVLNFLQQRNQGHAESN
ncbi:MAG TPA: sulfate ABC transporter permease subunit CysT [Candidatus Aminicenantes bacterium]|nr:sulfate ABC transporter permease subunit CysT [Candidatus Aminicenantes bacterium]